MAEVRYMSVAEFRREGYLQELNRLFLHPLGLALETVVEGDPFNTEHFGGIWDFRANPEGIRYDHKDLEPMAVHVKTLWDAREPDRVAALGYMVQPESLERE